MIVFPDLIHRKIGRYLIKKINKLNDLKWLIENNADLIIVRYGTIVRDNSPNIQWFDNPEILDYKLDPIYLSSYLPCGLKVGDNINDTLYYLNNPLYIINKVPIDQIRYFIIKTKKLFNQHQGTEHICFIYLNLLSNKIIPNKIIPLISFDNFKNNNININNFHNKNDQWSIIKIKLIEIIRNINKNKSFYFASIIGFIASSMMLNMSR